jgi:integrase
MQRAFLLAIETGQRQADLLRLGWNNIEGDIIRLRQSKTGVDVAIPISPRLRKCLTEAPRGSSVTVLTTERGLPWNPKGNGFRSAWREACAFAGVSGPKFHDLRGTFATRRLAEGWSAEDVAFCTGHSLRDLASFERYVSRGDVAAKRAQAMAKRLAETNP